MPTVRRAERQVGITPLRGGQRTAAATAASEGAGLEAARADRAGAAAQFGGRVAEIGIALHAEGARRADELRIQAADRALAEWELERLHDPERGALQTVKGKDSMGLPETIRAEFDARKMEIEQTLLPKQRGAFNRLAGDRRLRLQQAVMLYTAKEMDAHEAAETDAAVTAAVRTAIANTAVDPTRIPAELARIEAVVRRHAEYRGLGAEARGEQLTNARTAAHEGVIQTLLAQGRDRAAAEYFERFELQIAGDRLASIEQALDSGRTAGEALRAATEIWGAHGPQTDDDAIQLDRMEAAARARFGNDAKTLDATIAQLRYRKAGVDNGRKERAEAHVGAVYRDIANGATLEQIVRSPAYAQLRGAEQVTVRDYLVKQAEHQADRSHLLGTRAAEAARRHAAAQEQAGWASYWHYSRPEVLTSMSEAQVLALVPEVGVQHVNRLMDDRRKLAAAPDKLREATIDDELFKTIAHGAGLQPYESGLKEAGKARLGQLRNAVESAIDAEQRAKGRPLHRDEKQTVMQRIIDRRVMLDRWTPASVPVAAVVNASDRAKAYVPINEIPEASLTEWVNQIRSEFPREQQAHAAAIILRYRDRIQRAHAAALLALGGDEERRRLRGQ